MDSTCKARALLLAGSMTFAMPALAFADTTSDNWRQRDAMTGDWGGLRPAPAKPA